MLFCNISGLKKMFLTIFAQPQHSFDSTSTKLQPNLISTSTSILTSTSTSNQLQPQSRPQLNINLNQIWLWHKSNPILLHLVMQFRVICCDVREHIWMVGLQLPDAYAWALTMNVFSVSSHTRFPFKKYIANLAFFVLLTVVN